MRCQIVILLFVILNLGACSSNNENSVQYKPAYGRKNLTFGKMRQSLTMVLYALEGGEMVDRAGLNMIAHATSIFYGYDYKETDQNEEIFLRSFCRQNNLPGNTHKCLKGIIKNMLAESKKLISFFKDDISFKKHIKEIENNLFQLIDHRLHQKNPFRFPLLELKNERVQLARPLKAKSKYLRRLPPGIELTINNNKMILSGEILRNKLEEADKIKPLLMKTGNLKPPRVLSLFIAKSIKTRELLPLFKLMISAGIDHFVLWGKAQGLAVGFKVNLHAGKNESNKQSGFLLKKFNNWQQVSKILSQSFLEGKTPKLVVIPEPKIKKQKKPAETLFKPADLFSNKPLDKLQPK